MPSLKIMPKPVLCAPAPKKWKFSLWLSYCMFTKPLDPGHWKLLKLKTCKMEAPSPFHRKHFSASSISHLRKWQPYPTNQAGSLRVIFNLFHKFLDPTSIHSVHSSQFPLPPPNLSWHHLFMDPTVTQVVTNMSSGIVFLKQHSVRELKPTENDLSDVLIFPRVVQASTILDAYTMEALGHQLSKNPSWEELLKSQSALS